MEISLLYLIKALILPPGINIFFVISGYVLLKKKHRAGSILILIALISLYLFSTSFVSRSLAALVETTPPLPLEISAQTDRQAIIILGGASHAMMPEYGQRVPYPNVLERLRYGLRLQRQTQLPILLSGGSVFDNGPSEAWVMDQVLREDFQISARWLEDSSRNTAQNAQNSYAILHPLGIEKIFLVTHAAHITRAVPIFEQLGFDVTPAPTIFLSSGVNYPTWMQFFPSSRSLQLSRDMLHELLGIYWYRMRH